MKCHRCGKENPAEVHTCSFLALLLADKLYRRGETKTPRTVADELVRMHNENEALRETLAVMLRDYAAVHDDGDAEMQPAIYQARAALAQGEKK
jgi:hypothetical protein